MDDEKSIHAFAAWKHRANTTNVLVTAIQPQQAALPVTELGISLSYLKRFSGSLGDWIKGGDTTAVVKAIVVTLTAKAPWSKKGRCAECVAGCEMWRGMHDCDGAEAQTQSPARVWLFQHCKASKINKD